MTFNPYDNESHKVLCDLGKILVLYLNVHGDQYPDSVAPLGEIYRDYDVNFAWAKQHIKYKGKGMACRSNPPDMVIAFDEAMLAKDQETYVLFNDAHVEHVSSNKATELRLTTL